MNYSNGLEIEEGEPIYYYREFAKKMRAQEKVTMYIDFSHLSSFQFQDQAFMKTIVHEFFRYEPNLREGLTKFMQKVNPEQAVNKKSYYQIAIFNLPQMSKIRELRTLSLGRLMSIYGTVTRTTDAKPELMEGTFMCMQCKNVVHNVEQQFKYTEPVRCSNPNCMNKTDWELINKDSVMLDW